MTLPALVSVLRGERRSPPPIWLMRQAGRHLPEYRELRTQAPDFISFCLNPEMAAEATLQPMRRYLMSAAIVFADILLLPHVIGQSVRFEPGHGPVLEALSSLSDIQALDWKAASAGLTPVSETIQRVRAALEPDRAVIGFAGAPWTVATYMVGGGKEADRWTARQIAYSAPDFLDALLDRLAEASADYLIAQINAGADAVQIFDSWTEALPEPVFERNVIKPTAKIVERIRAAGIETPIIGFPRGCGVLVARYARETGVTAVSLDMNQASEATLALLPDGMPVQGGLDPAALRAGGDSMTQAVKALLAATRNRPYVFNLGHGISPDVPIAHVEALVDAVQATR